MVFSSIPMNSMTLSQWILYYSAELMLTMPGLRPEDAVSMAEEASRTGVELPPEQVARARSLQFSH